MLQDMVGGGQDYTAYKKSAMQEFCKIVEQNSGRSLENWLSTIKEKKNAAARQGKFPDLSKAELFWDTLGADDAAIKKKWESWKEDGSRPNGKGEFHRRYEIAIELGWINPGGCLARLAGGKHYVLTKNKFLEQKAWEIERWEEEEEFSYLPEKAFYESLRFDPWSLESAAQLRAKADEIERNVRYLAGYAEYEMLMKRLGVFQKN